MGLTPYSGTYLDWLQFIPKPSLHAATLAHFRISAGRCCRSRRRVGLLRRPVASACCAGPLVLVVLGIGGAWGSRLIALAAAALMSFPLYAPLFYCGVPMKFTALVIAGLFGPAGAMAADSRTVTLDVTRMDWSVCPITVRKALEKVPGVEAARVDFRTKRAVVAFDPVKTSPAALTRATSDAGFPSTVKQVQ